MLNQGHFQHSSSEFHREQIQKPDILWKKSSYHLPGGRSGFVRTIRYAAGAVR
jgi:hypothetical protein